MSAGAAGVAATTTAGMAASGVVAGLAVGRFADNSSSRQQAFVKHMKENTNENTIHIYPDKIYIGLKKLPASGSILTIYEKDSCHKRVLCKNITQITRSC